MTTDPGHYPASCFSVRGVHPDCVICFGNIATAAATIVIIGTTARMTSILLLILLAGVFVY